MNLLTEGDFEYNTIEYITSEKIIEYFKVSSENSFNSLKDIVKIIESLAKYLLLNLKRNRITRCRIIELLCNQITASEFGVDTFWLFHIYGLIDFKDYIKVCYHSHIDNIDCHVRNVAFTKREDDIEDVNDNQQQISICRSIIKYLFQLALIACDINAETSGISMFCFEIIINFLVKNDESLNGIYYVHDSWHIGCIREVITIMFAGEECSAALLEFEKRVFIALMSKCQTRTQLFNCENQNIFDQNFIDFLSLFHFDIFLPAIDHMLHDPRDNILNENRGYLTRQNSVVSYFDLFLECYSFCFVSKISSSDKESCLASQYNTFPLRQLNALNALYAFPTLEVIGPNPMVFDFLSILSLLAETAVSSVYHNYNNVFLRVVNLADKCFKLLSNIEVLFASNSDYNVNDSASYLPKRLEQSVKSSNNDELDSFFTKWLEIVLRIVFTQPSLSSSNTDTMKTLCNRAVMSAIASGESLTEGNFFLYISMNSTVNSNSIYLGAAVDDKKSSGCFRKNLKFICLSLVECLSHQSSATILSILRNIKSYRCIHAETVDLYITTANSHLKVLELKYPKISNIMGVAVTAETAMTTPSITISRMRLFPWIETFSKQRILTVGLRNECKNLGSSVVLSSFQKLAEGDPAIVNTLKDIVTYMSKENPPLCSNLQAKQFLYDITCRVQADINTQDIISSLYSSLGISQSMRKLTLRRSENTESISQLLNSLRLESTSIHVVFDKTVSIMARLNIIIKKCEILSDDLSIRSLNVLADCIASSILVLKISTSVNKLSPYFLFIWKVVYNLGGSLVSTFFNQQGCERNSSAVRDISSVRKWRYIDFWRSYFGDLISVLLASGSPENGDCLFTSVLKTKLFANGSTIQPNEFVKVQAVSFLLSSIMDDQVLFIFSVVL